MDPVSTTIATATAVTAATTILNAARALVSGGIAAGKDAADANQISLTQYAKMLRISSRVYIDASVSADAATTDVIKTIHTQYVGLILAGLQMNQFVTKTKSVQDLLRVVATEDNKPHEAVVEGLFEDHFDQIFPNNAGPQESPDKAAKRQLKEKREKEQADKDKDELRGKASKDAPQGKIVKFDGNNHIPAGKVIEVTLHNPENKDAEVKLNLLVQLSPYIVPEPIAVQFIVKDVLPSLYQRYMQWSTGEIGFWRDFVAQTDIVKHREKLMKLDPTGMFADMLGKQQSARGKAMDNLSKDKAERARNLANSVMIFNAETVQRAKAESGINLINYEDRQRYFASSFAMIIVVMDLLYNQATFYYNGIEDAATFSFSQLKLGGDGGGALDVVAVMNALNQGRSPKF